MKTIGLIGGMSWESSLEYYKILNETTKDKLGGLHSSKCIMLSVDFAEVEELQSQGRWREAAVMMIEAGRALERAGADFIVICTNTMHKLADDLQQNVNIPLLHIADATAERITASGLKTIGLLGTKFTMEEDFYKGRLIHKHGLRVIIPDEADREIIHRVIYDELCLGVIKRESRERYIDIMKKLVKSGAEGIILGCTEIELLIHEDDGDVPLFPTTKIHAISAVEFALGER